MTGTSEDYSQVIYLARIIGGQSYQVGGIYAQPGSKCVDIEIVENDVHIVFENKHHMIVSKDNVILFAKPDIPDETTSKEDTIEATDDQIPEKAPEVVTDVTLDLSDEKKV